MPLYKSFGDIFVNQFVNHKFGIESGFTFGSFEDTPRLKNRDGLMHSSGYIFSRRNPNQSLQSDYINSALLTEIISTNNVTTVFQNGERFRSGKIYNRINPDMAIKWLLNAFENLQKLDSNITIVPVMISYDRIFEQGNLSREMITSE